MEFGCCFTFVWFKVNPVARHEVVSWAALVAVGWEQQCLGTLLKSWIDSQFEPWGSWNGIRLE